MRGTRRQFAAMAGVLGVSAALALAQAAPSTAVVGYAAADSAAPVTENVARSDIQYADDESQPQRDGWFWLRYDQKGSGAQAEIVRDLSPEAHGDGSLHLVARAQGDQVAVKRLTAAPGAARLPLADVASGSFDVRVTSGAAASFVIEVNCNESTTYPYGDVRLTYAGPMPAGAGWHTVDVVQGGAAVWTRAGSSTPVSLGDAAQGCPIGTVVNYGVWLSSPGDVAVDNVSLNDRTSNFRQPVLERVGGTDRLQTACFVAERQFSRYEAFDPYTVDPWRPPQQARTLVLASDRSFPDALAAAPLATALDAPLLLNHGTGLDTGHCSLMAPGTTVYVVGGEGVISMAAESALRSQGMTPIRIGGRDRYATAVSVATALDGMRTPETPDNVFLASGTDFPDALSAGAPAGAARGAVLLTAGRRMPSATAAYLAQHPAATAHAIGGPAAAAVDLPSAREIVGSDRFDTAVRVADRFFAAPTSAVIASGAAFADALSGSAYAGGAGQPVILVAPHAVPEVVAAWAGRQRDTVRGSLLLGGTGAVDQNVHDTLRSALTPPA